MWFDAKDIQSVASNYIILEPSTVDGKLFSMCKGTHPLTNRAP
jgi:hypothetical protein